jgi:hypothetical protein
MEQNIKFTKITRFNYHSAVHLCFFMKNKIIMDAVEMQVTLSFHVLVKQKSFDVIDGHEQLSRFFDE